MGELAKRESANAPQWGIEEIARAAEMIARSGLFGMKTPEQAAALMLIAQAEGMHPAAAARDYHIIQGRPALRADAMLARFQQAGGKVEWLEYTDQRVSARFSHPNSPKPVTVTWDMEQAKRAGLAGKDNWRKYPRQMLRARVISEGVRMTFPGVAVGVYTPEEVADFDDGETVTAEYREVPAAPAPKPAKPSRPYAPAELREAIRKAADALDGKPLEDGETKRAAIAEILATSDGEVAPDLLAWLVGEREPHNLTGAETAALWRWLKPERDEAGWLPDPVALQELDAAIAALKSGDVQLPE